MRTKTIAILLLIILALLVGCKNSNSVVESDIIVDSDIITEENYLDKYNVWTNRLDTLALTTKSTYNDWVNNKINTEEFLNATGEIKKKVKNLNMETDYNTINIKDENKGKVNFNEVTKSYGKASKDLNDFLEISPFLKDNEIKEKYSELILNNYDQDFLELKLNLAVQE